MFKSKVLIILSFLSQSPFIFDYKKSILLNELFQLPKIGVFLHQQNFRLFFRNSWRVVSGFFTLIYVLFVPTKKKNEGGAIMSFCNYSLLTAADRHLVQQDHMRTPL